MAPLTLEGETLGEKHKHFNKLVQETLTNKEFLLTKINNNDGDIDNLLKIDMACKTRNVEYILEVLKCDDMLYVSRAIKQSTWLITEQDYAHILNPKYLYTQLFPHMLAKAISKFLLHVRLNLKDEKRVEEFYDYLKNQTNCDEPDKWLLHCSIPFIEKTIENQRSISLELFKRLCKRSVKFLLHYTKVVTNRWRVLESVVFLIKSDPEEYFNILDATKDYSYSIPTLRQKHTEIVMKTCPQRILDKFDRYKSSVDLSVVAKHLKKEDIKDFVLKHAQNNDTKYFFTAYDNLKHFIKNMPKEERFDFVKTIYIDKKRAESSAPHGLAMDMVCCSSNYIPSCSINSYNWYQYAPFEVAFVEIKKLVRAESSPAERCAMLSVLITCTRKNPNDAKILLEYYYNKHRNEPFKFKIQFVNNVLNQMATHNFDKDTWNILDKLFYSLEVYTESENNVQTCLKSIVLYKVLHDESVPDIVVEKIAFNTFKKCQSTLNDEQQKKLFSYLLSSITTKIQNKTIANETDFINTIDLLKDALNLLSDWKKDINQHVFIINKIQEIIKIKKENSWSPELSTLYNVNKVWRKHMFQISMMLHPSEEVCLNALKHDPQLLSRHADVLNGLRTNDNVSLRRLLSKIRIYWPNSFAKEWTDLYLSQLNKSTGHKALIRGLFVLLSQQQVLDIAKKHIPNTPKIEWSEIDQVELNLCKNIAKYLYIARPLTDLEVVLWYAIGDYLQYAVPSLNAIIHNMSVTQSRNHISKLLEAPVSLQKHGLHLAFIKLKYDELKPIFSDIWKSTKNSTIRTHLFTHTYNLLCKEKDPSLLKELWQLLSMFIDNLGTDENKIIFSKLGQVKNVPVSIQGDFFMKSYNVLTSLPAGANCENHLDNLMNYAPHIMDEIDADFVANKMLAFIEEKMSKSRSQCTDVIASFILHGKTEDEQCERFKKVLVPVLEQAFTSWNKVEDGAFVVKDNFEALTRALTWAIRKFLPLKKIVVPVKMFMELQTLMEEKMSIKENYGGYTSWKLTAEYVKLVAEHADIFNDPKLDNMREADYGNGWLPEEAEHIWEALHIKVSPKFGPIIVKHLKEDTEKYFPTICWLFSIALSKAFQNLSFQQQSMKMETLKYMILNNDYVPSYIVVCEEMPTSTYGDDNAQKKLIEVMRMLSSHPSLEVQMHYQRSFSSVTDLISETDEK